MPPFPAPSRRNVTTLDIDMQKQCPAWPGRGRKCTSSTASLNRSHLPGVPEEAINGPYSCGIQKHQLRCTARRDGPFARGTGGRQQMADGGYWNRAPAEGVPQLGFWSPGPWYDFDGTEPTAASNNTTWYRQRPSTPLTLFSSGDKAPHALFSHPCSATQPNGMRAAATLQVDDWV